MVHYARPGLNSTQGKRCNVGDSLLRCFWRVQRVEIGATDKAGLAGQFVATQRSCFWKQARHRTGLPWVGRNGTVVSVPQSAQMVRVSGRTRAEERRFALHFLQCFGSLVNFFSEKKSCSPAVKTKSSPQEVHFNVLSLNSITGFLTSCR